MMTHYYHFHQQNSPSSYHHRNKGSLIYLEQFQNHPIGIPKLMKMRLKTFEHPRTPCFREYPPRVPGNHSISSCQQWWKIGYMMTYRIHRPTKTWHSAGYNFIGRSKVNLFPLTIYVSDCRFCFCFNDLWVSFLRSSGVKFIWVGFCQ